MDNRELAAKRIAAAFNEWMRRFTETPEQFTQQFQDVISYLDDAKAGNEPAYGRECAAYLISLMEEADGAQAATPEAAAIDAA